MVNVPTMQRLKYLPYVTIVKSEYGTTNVDGLWIDHNSIAQMYFIARNIIKTNDVKGSFELSFYPCDSSFSDDENKDAPYMYAIVDNANDSLTINLFWLNNFGIVTSDIFTW